MKTDNTLCCSSVIVEITTAREERKRRLDVFCERLIEAAFEELAIERPDTFLVEAEELRPAAHRRAFAVWLVRVTFFHE